MDTHLFPPAQQLHSMTREPEQTPPHFLAPMPPHTPFGPLHPGRGVQPGPVLVWVFYWCGFAGDASTDAMTRVVLGYEDLRGRRDSMHVGLVLAWRTSTGLVEFESTEFGCFSGRQSGATELHALQSQDPAQPAHFLVQARTAMFLAVSPTFARELGREFGCLASSAAPPQYTHATRRGIEYPSTGSVVRAALALAVRPRCVPVRGGGAVLEQIATLREGPVQCAQFALAPLLSWIAAESVECETNAIDDAAKGRLRELADAGVGIHPAALKRVFEGMRGCNWLAESQTVVLGGVRTTLGGVCMTDPYTTIPCINQNHWAQFWRKVDGVR